MRPIQGRITLFAFVLATLSILVSGVMVVSYRDLRESIQEIHVSNLVESTVQRLPASTFDDETFKKLRQQRESLKMAERQRAMSNIIQAYSASSPHLIELRTHEFEETEAKYRNYMEAQVEYLEQRMVYFASLGAILLVTGIFYLRHFVISRVFSPLRSLNRQMFDFLDGKYSYEMKVPQQDELGDLQTNFNSMAQKVLQNMEELKALDAAKTEFLNIASHELRTPMTSIKGSLGLITSGAMGALGEEIKDLMLIAESETDRLIRLINDILDMAKIEAGRMKMNTHWVPITELASKTVQSLKSFADQAGITIEVIHDGHFEAYIDSDRVQQVMTNLLSNAVKFSPTGGTVWLRTQVDYDNNFLVEIIDQGRGISLEDQTQIFQKFRQASSSENPLVKGTGLGLAIAKAIIEEHGGKLGLYSQTGRGSNFFFTLPQFRAEAPRSAPKSSDTAVKSFDEKRGDAA